MWKAEARDLCACDSGSGSSNGGGGGPTVLVAVKGVKDGAGAKERGDLLRELGIMQHLGQHPNVVTLLGCCTQQGEAFPGNINCAFLIGNICVCNFIIHIYMQVIYF